ncbi:hypothetical protein KJ885_03660 [Patescibacteria group bacterium]|nr:hypothetical protein [Patescibacteria group bacterium]
MAKKENIKKETTLNELAVMVQRGFIDIEKRFCEKIDGVSNALGKRIDELEKELKQDIKEIWYKLDSLERRVACIEDIITEHSKILDEHSKILNEHSKELKEIKILIQKYQTDKKTNQEKIFSLEKRVEKLEIKVFI